MSEAEMSLAEWQETLAEALAYQASITGRRRPSEWPARPFGYHFGLKNKYITADMIRHFAQACGDPNPVWSDPDYARNTRWGGIIAPPTFEHCLGFPNDQVVAMTIPGVSRFDAGALREYYAPFRPGDAVTAVDTYLGLQEKSQPGKIYRLFLQQNEKIYYNQRGEKVMRSLGRTIMTATPPGQKARAQEQIAGGIKRPHYTQEQLDAVYRAYEEELEGKSRRGSEPRYWEDVAIGEEIRPLLKGPLSDCDVASYVGAISFIAAFAVKWKATTTDPRVFLDPETGAVRSVRDWHHSDTIAQVAGMPYAIGEGQQNQSVIAHAITNWMGDDGFLKKLDLQCRSSNYHGDLNRATGTVTGKFIENGEHLVELQVAAECQDGRVHTKGSAVVRLLSRAV